MDNLQIIEKATGVVYHELGHLFGYALANYHEKTSLGQVSEFSIGKKKSCVGVENSYYHFKNLKTERERIYSNTNNKGRTIAWFIEVVSGCTFQAVFESKSFNLCFGVQQTNGGRNDYFNILAIIPLCSFDFNMHDIFALQNRYANLVIKYDLVNHFLPMVSKIKDELANSDDIQIDFNHDGIEYFYNICKDFITEELYKDYEKLIKDF
ncbi:hypothetical protein NAL32_19715 [Chryseobacterium sp. Ch-15]|uniref:Uncharacterized protein n=1 Tax=Chryseobacterium muglaense TaxID=2893752 RepID=A0A9Q3YPQ5_9FLAO|nr:hypothetical protein [Chryseobacterium muglaense]MBD3906885.1 hypothetical protein [Chryseobacterium muglaense]MCC9033039.1 hypothetical protein [Chryseobacterium muglaense]MCM2556623.1 hypothetical protein [Chryseobacterium muglaense]